uniref:Protein-tyrosine-phosphatase n=1 Tax=Rhabditophanes sp. KR3021 TaxID=114890 RepID=A0AC35UII1_9BILA
MNLVVSGLYVSGSNVVISNSKQYLLRDNDVKSVITVAASPIPEEKKIPGISYHFYYCLDEYTQDMLGNNMLETILDTIISAIKEGNVLVHCEQGVSRSVTICTAYVMKIFSWKYHKAIEYVKKQRPESYPNKSFEFQLQIFEELGWCFSELKINPISKYTCRKCRGFLFSNYNIMHHPIQNNKFFNYLLIRWPKVDIHSTEQQGKLVCPKCNDKIGQFDVNGRRCFGSNDSPCNGYVKPWICVQECKVDVNKSVQIRNYTSITSNNPKLRIPEILITQQD